MSRRPDAEEVFAIVDRIKPLLAGRASVVQSAVLAELLSLWLAGHDASAREMLLSLHLELVRELTVANAHILRGANGKGRHDAG